MHFHFKINPFSSSHFPASSNSFPWSQQMQFWFVCTYFLILCILHQHTLLYSKYSTCLYLQASTSKTLQYLPTPSVSHLTYHLCQTPTQAYIKHWLFFWKAWLTQSSVMAININSLFPYTPQFSCCCYFTLQFYILY